MQADHPARGGNANLAPANQGDGAQNTNAPRAPSKPFALAQWCRLDAESSAVC
jgi:hypothetical protein